MIEFEAPQVVVREDRGTLVVSGPDRCTWLNGVLSCDVSRVTAERGVWGLALTKTGKVLADVVVLAAGERLLLCVPRDRAAALCEWLERFLIMEDADIDDESTDWAWVELHGPGAYESARTLAGDRGSASAVDFATGLEAALLALPRAESGAALVRAKTDLALTEMSAEAWLRFRVARFIPSYGVDFDEKRSPHEASLERRAVSWEKGCYLGQEAVCMQDMRGKVKRRLVPLALNASRPPEAGAAVFAGSDGTAPVGEVTSSALLSPDRAVAIARVREAFSAVGTRVRVNEDPGEVVEPRG